MFFIGSKLYVEGGLGFTASEVGRGAGGRVVVGSGVGRTFGLADPLGEIVVGWEVGNWTVSPPGVQATRTPKDRHKHARITGFPELLMCRFIGD